MDTQNKDLLKYFETHKKGITQKQAMQKLGIGRLSARVFDLRHQGHLIDTSIISVKNRHGRKSHVANYVYIGKVEA